jgi:thymidylate kinase
MGVRNYLIEGVSGAGKTSVAEELQRRGRHVVHGDLELAYLGDPETGERLDGRAPDGVTDSLWWKYGRWIWNVDKVRSLVADQRHAQSFFCGGSRNSDRFVELFDQVFVLDVDLDTLNGRVAPRQADEFGGKPEEWALIARVHASKEGLPKGAVSIDATAPVTLVVDEILARCGEAEAPLGS